MAIQHLDTSPKTEDFTPLKEHEERTPTTFFDAKPVLYANYSGLTLSAPAEQLQQDAAFSKFARATEGDDALVKDATIWVSSEYGILHHTLDTTC
jgi:nucleotide-sensitive chloride channel 1A